MNILKISFSDFWGGYDPNDNFWTLTLKKLEIPYQVVDDNSDLLISSCFGASFLRKKSKKKILWCGENWFRMDTKIGDLGGRSMIDIFDMVYSFDYNNYENHYRLPLYLIDCIERDVIDFNLICRNKSKDLLFKEFKNRKFCTFVQGNGNCKFRNDYFLNLSNIDKVDSYGPLFNNTGQILDRIGKIEKTKNYKFALAFENSEYDGYVSEKLMDAFKSDILPIYWGGSKVSSEFNSNSFVDVNKLGMDKSLDLIKELNTDFDLYWEYYNQKIISDEQQSLANRINDFDNQFKSFLETILEKEILIN
jgi:hypothetical protein